MAKRDTIGQLLPKPKVVPSKKYQTNWIGSADRIFDLSIELLPRDRIFNLLNKDIKNENFSNFSKFHNLPKPKGEICLIFYIKQKLPKELNSIFRYSIIVREKRPIYRSNIWSSKTHSISGLLDALLLKSMNIWRSNSVLLVIFV